MSTSDSPPINDPEDSTVASRITVLMPVYNAERYLAEALESILGQTYRNFRLVVVDDASTDSSPEILDAVTDARIEIIRLDKPRGVAHALNVALDLADTEFVARMDADDLAAPDRFYQQLAFLSENLDVGVCGSSIEMMRGQSRCFINYPETHEEILCCLAIFKRSVCHPSVMIRRSVLEDTRYSESYAHAEDLHMWNSLIQQTRFHNIPTPLLAYRLHDDQVSEKYKSSQIDGTRKLLAETLPRYFPSAEDSVHMTLLDLLVPDQRRNGSAVKSLNLSHLYARLMVSNDRDTIIPERVFESVILSKFFEETCKQYLGFRNMAFVWLRTLQREPALFLEVCRRLRFQLVSCFLRERNQ
ncbi:MAG: glycosyltransferase [Halioglobus sp.]|nr:glycosyltransferase [Halioglobus sp.]